ncbi:MAG: hypothetical protein JXB20_03045 [Bacilli bacterium]|nr:hypothetical protein [Bacilli bacterium]MBN2696448.1 hypothetical protein [Bacilli bacterium]
MKKEIRDLSQKMRSLGVTIAKKTEEGISKAKDSIENTIFEEKLHRRFNLENPYKFQIIKDRSKTNFISAILPKNAKRYEEDDVFVFYGDLDYNNLEKGNVIRDLSNNADYEIKELIEVNIPVSYEDKTHEVTGTAAVCELL